MDFNIEQMRTGRKRVKTIDGKCRLLQAVVFCWTALFYRPPGLPAGEDI